LLDDRSVGFHAGHPPTNWESIGIVLIDDLTNTLPTPEAIEMVNRIIGTYPDVAEIIGHKEVPGRANIVCPGNRWPEWKPLLKLPA
jgi:hypothetical protein